MIPISTTTSTATATSDNILSFTLTFHSDNSTAAVREIWYDSRPSWLDEQLAIIDDIKRRSIWERDVFRGFVLARSPMFAELEPEEPPARAIVSRRTALRSSARAIRNWRRPR
jgi:hypothetical protein